MASPRGFEPLSPHQWRPLLARRLRNFASWTKTGRNWALSDCDRQLRTTDSAKILPLGFTFPSSAGTGDTDWFTLAPSQSFQRDEACSLCDKFSTAPVLRFFWIAASNFFSYSLPKSSINCSCDARRLPFSSPGEAEDSNGQAGCASLTSNLFPRTRTSISDNMKQR